MPWFDKLTTNGILYIDPQTSPRLFAEFILRRFIDEGLRMTRKETWFDKLTTNGRVRLTTSGNIFVILPPSNGVKL